MHPCRRTIRACQARSSTHNLMYKLVIQIAAIVKRKQTCVQDTGHIFACHKRHPDGILLYKSCSRVISPHPTS